MLAARNPGSVKKMRKTGRIVLVLLLCLMSLAGCGEAKVPEVVDTPTVAVGKEGDVTVWMVGEFDKSYYNLAELANMAAEEVKEYNSTKGKEAVSVDKADSLEGGRVVVSYKFDGWQSCTDFCESHIFFGTVNEAGINGFDLGDSGIVMKSAKDGTPLSGSLLQDGEKRIVITDMKANIYCPSAVAYISEGAIVNSDGSISPGDTEGLIYILLK